MIMFQLFLSLKSREIIRLKSDISNPFQTKRNENSLIAILTDFIL